jgi:hypothetical protein
MMVGLAMIYLANREMNRSREAVDVSKGKSVFATWISRSFHG